MRRLRDRWDRNPPGAGEPAPAFPRVSWSLAAAARATGMPQANLAPLRHTAAMSSPSQTLLILGASGDLTARLLLPGLGGLLARGDVEAVSLLGSGMDEWDDDRWRGQVAESFAAADASGEEVDAVAGAARYLQADVTAEADLGRLLQACDGAPVIYFALP